MDSVQTTPVNSLEEAYQNGGHEDFGDLDKKLLHLGLEDNAHIEDHDEDMESLHADFKQQVTHQDRITQGLKKNLNTSSIKGKKKPKSMNKEAAKDGDSEAYIDEDAKPCRVGTLPKYGFSFKCDERAEKRKEYYTKLEEKINAQEVEKTNLQAKSKETQEAELKLLRKRLSFKATPMPNFYQEPSPPRIELKRTPPTRAKSPKLGRRKGSAPLEESKEYSAQINRSGRLSLDEKAPSRSQLPEGIATVSAKKTIRKSLPKLPSQKTAIGKEKDNPTPSCTEEMADP